MATFTADPNMWYTIMTNPIPPYQIWVNTSLTTFEPGNDFTSTFFAPISNLTLDKWQFYPVTSPANGTYVLRPHLHIGGFLRSVAVTGTSTSCMALGWDCSTSAGLAPTIDLNSAWTFTNPLDGTDSFYMSNAANGSTYHLDLWPNGSWLRLTNNITGSHPTQQFLVTPVGAIDDVAWQSINSTTLLFAGANSTMPNVTFPATSASSSSPSAISTSTTSSSPTLPPSHSGLSPGASAGIGAGIGLVGALLLAFLLFRLYRRRKTSKNAQVYSTRDGQFATHDIDLFTRKTRHSDEGMALVEAHSEAAVEAPGHETRWELDAEETRRGGRD